MKVLIKAVLNKELLVKLFMFCNSELLRSAFKTSESVVDKRIN